jgi:hypothetical protein
MNKIPKCKSKYYIPQGNNIKVSYKEYNKENLAPKITQKNLKFSANRQFGKDITNSMNGNIHNLYSNHGSKIVKIIDKTQNSSVYIKKHSSASQIAQKARKIKMVGDEKKLRENKSGSLINKKNEVSGNENIYKNNNVKIENVQPQIGGGSKLHSSISFGLNNLGRPISSNNPISVRLSNPKNKKISSGISNRSISTNNNSNIIGNTSNNINNNLNNNNAKIQITHSNLDLV